MADKNIMQMKVNQFVELMAPLYASKEGVNLPSIMQWGPPGIGKSQSVQALKRQLEKLTGKTVNITDVRLLLFNPVDLRGIPCPDVNREYAIWLRPQIFNMDASEDVINILFLDEISAAPLSVQAAAYQMTLDRQVGEHKLPNNCIVICAGNRVTDKAVAYKMPKPLGNRMTHLEIIPDVDDWKKWAINAGISKEIIGYINYMGLKALFDFDPSNDDVAFPSPRSWEMVHKYLEGFDDIDTAFPLIAGSIGIGAATEFKAYTKVYSKLPDIKAIFDGTEKSAPPVEADVLYALSSAIVSASAKANKNQLSNVLEYTYNMKAEFATLTIKDLIIIDEVRSKMCLLPTWIKWSQKYKNFIM